VEVVKSGKRRWIAPHCYRGNNYFHIGWDWAKTALETAWRLVRRVRFTGNRDLHPAMASRQQHQKRTYQLEFTVWTYQYVPDYFCQSTMIVPLLEILLSQIRL
jgi:hypothetical protein